MHSPNSVAKSQDVVAGITLILIGSLGLIATLGVFDLDSLPSLVRYGWPVVLIEVGLVLWMAERASHRCGQRVVRASKSREADYVR